MGGIEPWEYSEVERPKDLAEVPGPETMAGRVILCLQAIPERSRLGLGSLGIQSQVSLVRVPLASLLGMWPLARFQPSYTRFLQCPVQADGS